MKVFGLTGGVGMGKSTVEQLLRQRGLPVVDTDTLARQIVEPGQPALQEILRTFGPRVVDEAGRLRREELARIVFPDPAARQQLESITHPRIRDLWMRQVETWRAGQQPVAVVVIPLLFETSAEKNMNVTVCVACSKAVQQQRLKERGWSADQIRQRIAAQWPIEKKVARSDFVIWTEGQPEILRKQLDRIFNAAPATTTAS